MHQKKFADIVLTVLVILLAGVAGYFALRKSATEPNNQFPTPTDNQVPVPSSQTQMPTNNTPTAPQLNSETAGWKTYSNKQYGFEVKYPSDFGISINPPGSTVIFRLANNETICDMYVGPIYNHISDLLAPQSSTQKKMVTNVTIAGHDGKKIQEEEYGLDAGLVTTYAGYVVRDNLHYLFSCVYGRPINDSDGARFDKILSTFKFTR